MSKIIAFTNQKGGVGKTSLCAGICGCLSAMGKSVLAIDLDPQGNLGFSLGAELDGRGIYTMYDVFKGAVDLYDIIQHLDACDIAPSNIVLSNAELEISKSAGRERILKDQLDYFAHEYDYVLIDTPPSLSVLTINAYTAADWLIVPMLPEILSLQGLAQLEEAIYMAQSAYNRKLEVRGIVLNKYNPRLTLTRNVEEMAGIVADRLRTEILETKITQSVTIAEAPAHAKAIIDYSPKSKAALELTQLTYEILGVSKNVPIRKYEIKRGRPRKYID